MREPWRNRWNVTLSHEPGSRGENSRWSPCSTMPAKPYTMRRPHAARRCHVHAIGGVAVQVAQVEVERVE